MTGVAVQVDQLTKKYGAQLAVDGLSFSVPEGAIFGLLGPNGAGKSTTFGAICGWLQPAWGSTSVLGVPSSRLHTLFGKVTALPQDARFPDAIPIVAQLAHQARLCGMSAREAATEAERVLALVDLGDAARKRGDELSHGMAKRAGIAQAMIGNPRVVLLDEPTAGLDPANARRLREVIVAMAPAATVGVSSHNLAEIQDICTHGAIIDHGKLVRAGTIAELTRQGNELVVWVRAGADVPVAALERAFGGGSVTRDDVSVRIVHGDAGDGAEAVATAMRVLLDAKVPVLGVTRGTSLETAFLELTGR